MQDILNHPWNLTVTEAVNLQKSLMSKVISCKLTKPPKFIGGVDCAPSADQLSYYAAAVIWDLQTRQLLEYHIEKVPLNFPYIPGLLSFREIPAILATIKKIKQNPDVIIVDGHGIAHPRRFGIAAHLGVLLDCPTFGCGKSLLYGHYQEPALERGSISHLVANNKVIGNVVRTRTKIRPVIISIGHKIDIDTATELTLICGAGFRLPEPTRLADKFVAEKQVKSFIASDLFVLEP